MRRIRSHIIWFLSLGIFLSGCAAPSARRIVPQDIILQDLCQRYNVNWDWDSVSQVVTLSRRGLKAKAMVGSDLVIVGEEKINLSVPLKRKKGVVIVPSDFKRKIIDRLTEKTEYPLGKFRAIMIDPGHGGKDPGAIGHSGLKEKIVVLDIAQRLKRNLEAKGFKVSMTRDSDEFISLDDRVRMANGSGTDIFVSIHANASRARSIQGFEIYFLKNLDHAALREIHAATNYQDALNRFAVKQSSSTVGQIVLDMMYVHKQSESRRLARYLAKNTTDTINSVDRGTKPSGFFVLKNTLIPAILIEVGFLSNKTEEGLLRTSDYRQQLADGLAKSILQYASQN